MAGGVHGRRGVHSRDSWQGGCACRGVCVASGMPGGGHVWWEVCMVGGALHGRGV